MERRWNATQKSQSLEHKPTSAPTTGSGANTRGSLSPRAEVSDGLMRRYPWVASEHPQNPQQRFYQQQAEGLTRELKVRNPPPPLERDLRIIEG